MLLHMAVGIREQCAYEGGRAQLFGRVLACQWYPTAT